MIGAVIDTTPLSLTPFFKVMEIEDIHASERAGHLILKTLEMVEVRIAGDKNYSPCFPTDAMWQRRGNQTITYAERWADEYRAWKEGLPQEARGTPLEMLRPYGATEANLSLCRALKIYSIESLASLESHRLKALGMASNSLKEMAQKFLAERMSGATAMSEIEELKAEIERLKAGVVPEVEATPDVIETALALSDAEIEALEDEELKVRITGLTGSRPKGNPSHSTLVASYKELLAA